MGAKHLVDLSIVAKIIIDMCTLLHDGVSGQYVPRLRPVIRNLIFVRHRFESHTGENKPIKIYVIG